MARPLRIEYPGAWYHVMNRGRHRAQIFFDDRDYRTFFWLLGECSRLFQMEIHAYSLMPNHYHLLLRTLHANLSRMMKHLNGVYTQKMNLKYKKDGSLFKGRFKSIIVEEDAYLLELVRYIHQNPLKAGLERRLGEHLWTSHRAYLHDQDAMKWLKRDLILERFGEMRGQAKSNLHQFVSNPRSSEIDRILSKQRWPAILGSETFRKDLLKRFKHPLNQSGVANKKELFQTLSPEDLKTIVCDEAGCQGVELLQQRRGRHNDTRRAFIYLCREVLKLDCREIGIHLGGLGRAAVSRQYWLARSDVKSKGSSSQLIHRVQKQL